MNDRQRAIIGISAFMIALCTSAIAFRFLAVHKLRKIRKPGWDDWLALSAWPFIVITNALFIWWAAELGLGLHWTTIHSVDIKKMNAVLLYVNGFLLAFGGALPKFSVLCFYSRAFRSTLDPPFHWTLWIVGILNAVRFLLVVFAGAFQCHPIRKAWQPTVKGHCLPAEPWYFALGVPAVILDVIILLLPMPKLWRLRISQPRKFGLFLLFLCGYCVVICSIGRVVAAGTPNARENLAKDTTWAGFSYVCWLASEDPVAVFAISLPVIYSWYNHAQTSTTPQATFVSPSQPALTMHQGDSSLNAIDSRILKKGDLIDDVADKKLSMV